ncbi:calphotin-like [Trichoplusia ni]|uniref:Calphotin-like n=1 Tax=Trichoplusia ni TaxID=7111 RepID=A0A7E5WSN5_TRINI|nr:calphotin-like [Trichoplusia ni]
MKVLLLALFVAAVAAVPLPEDASDAVQMIVNGVPEGQALDVDHIVDIKLKEHADGQLVAASNLLHPYTAVGIAEAAGVAPYSDVLPEAVALPAPVEPEVVPSPVVLPAPVEPEVNPAPVVLPAPAAPEVVPSPVVLPAPVAPEVNPAPVVLPAPAAPEVVPSPVVLPAPATPEVVPAPVVLPAPVAPEVVPAPVVLPAPAVPEVVIDEALPAPAPQFPEGEVYNDGLVQVQVNGPEDPGMLATLQSWLSMVINYFNNGAVTSQQIV